MLDEEAVKKNIEETLEKQGITDAISKEEKQEAKEESKQEEKILDPVQKLAAEHGWDPEGSKSAEEFVKYGLDQLAPRGRELRDIKRTVNELKDHMKKVEEKTRTETIAELTQQRYDAISVGDATEVDRLDQEIQNAQQPEAASMEIPEVAEFQKKHEKWLKDDSDEAVLMKKAMLEADEYLARMNLEPSKHLALVEKELQMKFPHMFDQEEATIPSAVESDSARVKSNFKKTYNFNDLNADQKSICKDFEKLGVMSKEEYIDQLVKLGELGNE